MFNSPITNSTFQACVIQATSNIIAQFVRAWKNDEQFTILLVPILQAVLYSAMNTPPNYIWQEFLESTFPSHLPSSRPPSRPSSPSKSDSDSPSPKPTKPSLSKTNTLIKFLLDQTVGATLNTLFYSLFFSTISPPSTQTSNPAIILSNAWQIAQGEFWEMIIAGWKIWPLVSIICFAGLQSVEGRTLVGSLAGLGWGVYLALRRG